MPLAKPIEKPLVLFDGVCNLCNSSVSFILKHEKNSVLYFSSLQKFGQPELLEIVKNVDSIIFIEKDKVYTKSTAALKISKYLKGYSWARVFLIIPPAIRDFIYDIIAKNRYKWFGKKDQCMIPNPDLKARFPFD